VTYAFHPDAEREHLDAVAYYEDRQAGLGAEYLNEFERTMQGVCSSPNRFPVEKSPDIRRVGLTKFPYWILFRTTTTTIDAGRCIGVPAPSKKLGTDPIFPPRSSL
jgi:toxin ParE1/3/4